MDTRPVYFAQQREDAALEPIAGAPVGPPEAGLDFIAPLIANPRNTAEIIVATASSIFAQGLAKGTEAAFDWREHATLTDVVQQAQCGACWAIASAGCLSDRAAIATKSNPQLSGAEAIVCAAACKPACSSCSPQDGFSFASSKGLISDPSHKKELQVANLLKNNCEAVQSCAKGMSRVYGSATSKTVETIDQLRKEIAANGPVATVYRVHRDFLVGSDPRRGKPAFEESAGIYIHSDFQPSLYAPPKASAETEKKLSETVGYHAVVIVGWGTAETDVYIGGRKKKTTVPYWIVRNSWGDKWGDKGYFKCAQASPVANQSLGIDLPITVTSAGGVKQRYGGVSFAEVKGTHGASSSVIKVVLNNRFASMRLVSSVSQCALCLLLLMIIIGLLLLF